MRIGLICPNRQWAGLDKPFRAVSAGLVRLGHRVFCADPYAGWPLWPELPDAAFVWNGVHGLPGRMRGRLAAWGVTSFVMERGWFDRYEHTQIDHAGFNHTASWVGRLAGAAPPAGLRRLLRVAGQAPAAFAPRRGYVLVLGQVPTDAQLRDAEVRHPGPVVEAVTSAVAAGTDVRVRPHPNWPWSGRCGGAAEIIAGSLADAVAGARFCVTVNSNAGNEALAAGCPVLCLGPALYAIAGVALRTSLAGLPRALAEMAAGWRPDTHAVRNYLAHLACRQWSRAELADGWPLEKVLADAAA